MSMIMWPPDEHLVKNVSMPSSVTRSYRLEHPILAIPSSQKTRIVVISLATRCCLVGYALHTGGTLSGGLPVADWNDVEKSFRSQRPKIQNPQDIQVTTVHAHFVFPCADGATTQEGHLVFQTSSPSTTSKTKEENETGGDSDKQIQSQPPNQTGGDTNADNALPSTLFKCRTRSDTGQVRFLEHFR